MTLSENIAKSVAQTSVLHYSDYLQNVEFWIPDDISQLQIWFAFPLNKGPFIDFYFNPFTLLQMLYLEDEM